MVPEPATWARMIAGYGLVGSMVRRKAVVRQA
ncbi:PEPxxWA-CTERM sorting domain-containing protein [Sandaracinobacteroides hominis]|nr:PEPxxWA-CTERM sorting domain-containing protein [Sandaracinobacteroides hominis]